MLLMANENDRQSLQEAEDSGAAGPEERDQVQRTAELRVNRVRWISTWIALAALLFLWSRGSLSESSRTIPYSEFKAHLSNGEVAAVSISASEITGDAPLEGSSGRARRAG